MVNKSARVKERKSEMSQSAAEQQRGIVSTEEYQAVLKELGRLQQEQQRQNLAIAAAAHDMKVPLAVIKGYTDLLHTRKVGPLSEQQAQILQDMQSSCSKLQFYISELLNQGIATGPSRTHSMETGDLRECVESVFQEWIAPFESKKVDLQLVTESDLPHFSFEYRRVQQVIASLLDNALKFTPAGKSVQLIVQRHSWERRVSAIPPKQERRIVNRLRANSVLITVADTGLGISPECQQDIFEAYYTRGCGDVRSGTGLGLAIAREVAKAHGGKIWVESSLGVGSRFCLLLPLNRTDDSAAREIESSKCKDTHVSHSQEE